MSDLAAVRLGRKERRKTHGQTTSFVTNSEARKLKEGDRKPVKARGPKSGKKTCRAQIASIDFDAKARVNYVTGFHKRKDERRKKAQDELKIKKRKDLLSARAEKKAALKEAMYGAKSDTDDDGSASEQEADATAPAPEPKKYQSSFRTVTVVTSALDGSESEGKEQDGEEEVRQVLGSKKKRTSSSSRFGKEKHSRSRPAVEEEEEDPDRPLDTYASPLDLLKAIEGSSKRPRQG